MPHLKSFRYGWQDQNLARFILYKFCFLSEPVQIADDIGIDYFCTLFEEKRSQNKANSDLLPKNSFAIQIKAKPRRSSVELTGYLPYLSELELPFIMGIVNRAKLSVAFYSGEFLIPFFAYKGVPQHLKAKLCDRSLIRDVTNYEWIEETGPQQFELWFPKIAEINISTLAPDLDLQIKSIQDLCSLMQENIARYINRQFYFDTAFGGAKLIMAGPTSLTYIEAKFMERLAEFFFNLQIANQYPNNHDRVRQMFPILENLYQELERLYSPEFLATVERTYQNTKAKILND